jgi:hypothetical protein
MGNRPVDVGIVNLEERAHLTSSASSADAPALGPHPFPESGQLPPKDVLKACQRDMCAHLATHSVVARFNLALLFTYQPRAILRFGLAGAYLCLKNSLWVRGDQLEFVHADESSR